MGGGPCSDDDDADAGRLRLHTRSASASSTCISTERAVRRSELSWCNELCSEPSCAWTWCMSRGAPSSSSSTTVWPDDDEPDEPDEPDEEVDEFDEPVDLAVDFVDLTAPEAGVHPDRGDVQAGAVGQALEAVGEQLLLEGAELVVLKVAREHARSKLGRVRHPEGRAVIAPAHVVLGLRLLDDRVQLGQEGRHARAAAAVGAVALVSRRRRRCRSVATDCRRVGLGRDRRGDGGGDGGELRCSHLHKVLSRRRRRRHRARGSPQEAGAPPPLAQRQAQPEAPRKAAAAAAALAPAALALAAPSSAPVGAAASSAAAPSEPRAARSAAGLRPPRGGAGAEPTAPTTGATPTYSHRVARREPSAQLQTASGRA
eukprot:scaffold51734_cov60-Phaeocystis_antarctica.AAC.1